MCLVFYQFGRPLRPCDSAGEMVVFIQTVASLYPPSEHAGLLIPTFGPGRTVRTRCTVGETIDLPLTLELAFQDTVTAPESAFAGNVSSRHFSHDIFLLLQG